MFDDLGLHNIRQDSQSNNLNSLNKKIELLDCLNIMKRRYIVAFEI